MTMNDSWGFVKRDHNGKSPEMLIRHLVDTASKGGNYLLNVGPDAHGSLPPESLDRLREFGKWMSKYGASVYGSKPTPFGRFPWGTSAQNKTRVYLFVNEWPESVVLSIPVQPEGELSLVDVATGKNIAVTVRAGGVEADLSGVGGGKSQAVWSVPSTGGWEVYKTAVIGRLELPAGLSEVAFSAQSKPSRGVANIRSVKLVPVGK